MHSLVQLVVPMGVCVALPVLIVWLVTRAAINSDNKRAEVIIEAIKANNSIDASTLTQAFAKRRRTPRETLIDRLKWGCIWGLSGFIASVFSIVALIMTDEDSYWALLFFGTIALAVGISFLIVYFVSRKQLPLIEDESNKQ